MLVFDRVVFGQVSTLVHTVDAAVEPVVPSLTLQKTSENVDIVLPQGNTSFVETSREIIDKNVIVPVVRSFSVWKLCEALDLPAIFVPQQSDTVVPLKQFKKSQTVPIVYSVTIFEMCKALELNAKLADQSIKLAEACTQHRINHSTLTSSSDCLIGEIAALESWKIFKIPDPVTVLRENLRREKHGSNSKQTIFCDYLVGELATRESWK
ncbi:hypothetical protein NPIL_70211 [Nephila pilipes]|uniref:Uncharacterized protein n=1 Tax=Nephila pilipes TaxID=299642 RepID=A0A8X6MMK4_NEPPI|nr:hypothetical protein NPIL_70211 [Nephila pilipes]